VYETKWSEMNVLTFMNVTNDQIKEVFVYVSAMVFETVCAFAMLIVYRQKYELYKSSIDPKS
jgi:hypothetical protein